MDIEISTGKAPDIDRLVELFRAAGWEDKTDPARLDAMVCGSTVVATAWLGERMVGFARCLSDRAFNGQINNVSGVVALAAGCGLVGTTRTA